MFLMKMIKYLDLLVFYFFDFLGSLINLTCSFFGYYPSTDLGVKYLLYKEARRITTEHHGRDVDSDSKSKEADMIKEKAYSDE